MAEVQPEDGVTRIANKILEALVRVHLSPYEWRILLYLIRKTYGWNKKMDCIALSQFQSDTGIERRHVHVALKHLSCMGVIVVAPQGDRKPVSYGFQKDYDLWNLSPLKRTHHKLSPPFVQSVAPRRINLSPPGAPTKDNTKDNTKDIIPRASFGEFKNIKLSAEEYQKLCFKWKESFVKDIIEECGDWMKSNGKTKKDHYATLLGWGKRNIKNNPHIDWAPVAEVAKKNTETIQRGIREMEEHPELFERPKE